MSIITLSTVGFGAFTSNTEAGKIFGAFWMLFGVAALGAVIATLSTLLMALKDFKTTRVLLECSLPLLHLIFFSAF